MAATDLADLHNFEYHFETAAKTFLNTATGITVIRTVVETSTVAPRLDIQFQVMDSLEPYAPRAGGGSSSSQDYRAYNALFFVRVITDNATGGSADHATYVSKARAELMRTASNWSNSTGTLTGTCSIGLATNVMTGVGTEFTTEIAAGDKIDLGGESFTISSVTSNLQAILTADSGSALSGTATRTFSKTFGPNNPYYDLKLLKPAQTEYDTDGDFNITGLSFDVIFEIRDTAWPA